MNINKELKAYKQAELDFINRTLEQLRAQISKQQSKESDLAAQKAKLESDINSL